MRIQTSTALLLTVLAVAGCAAEDPTPTPSAAASDDLVPFQQVGASDAQALAAPYIGLTEADALAKAATDGVSARVGTAEDVGNPGLVDDYEVGRLTFVVQEGTVLEVIVEGDEGPLVVAAS